MPTESAEIQHLRARFTRRQEQLEHELNQIREMLKVLDVAPSLLQNSPPLLGGIGHTIPTKSVGRTLQNRNVTELVREYLDNFLAPDTSVNIPEVVKSWLQAKHNVKGKYRSLYSATCVILKKETHPPKEGGRPRLQYEKGVGFYKPSIFGQKLGQAQAAR